MSISGIRTGLDIGSPVCNLNGVVLAGSWNKVNARQTMQKNTRDAPKNFSPKVKNFWRLGPERCTQNEYRITRELKKIRLA